MSSTSGIKDAAPRTGARRGLGQTQPSAGRKSPATRRAEATLAAAKQAWRRADTAQARSKQLRQDLEAAPDGSGDRRRLALEAAEAAEESRKAKAAWRAALAEAEASMEDAKKGREASAERKNAVGVTGAARRDAEREA
jgi:hypothetical protein